MYDAINEAFLEFALTCKYMMKRGWEFGEINYGDRRLGVGSSLKIRRGDEEHDVYSAEDMAKILEKECYEEDRKKWENES